MYKVSCVTEQPLPPAVPAPIEHRPPQSALRAPRVWVHTWLARSLREMREISRVLRLFGVAHSSAKVPR